MDHRVFIREEMEGAAAAGAGACAAGAGAGASSFLARVVAEGTKFPLGLVTDGVSEGGAAAGAG